MLRYSGSIDDRQWHTWSVQWPVWTALDSAVGVAAWWNSAAAQIGMHIAYVTWCGDLRDKPRI